MANQERNRINKWITVRVFISSTFRDMHAERDHLVKRVFPKLRERLEKYRVHLIDIDLRWGITKEQAENNEVLGLCLNQIEKCHPFFIGILGERYGGVLNDLDKEILKNYGWIKEHPVKSLTELEILHGVLNNPKMGGHAFFYFRDPKALSDIPERIKEEIFTEECPENRKKLIRLKKEIRDSGKPILNNYPAKWDPEAYDRPTKTLGRLIGLNKFGMEVYKQLWEGIKAELNLPDNSPSKVNENTLCLEQEFQERFIEYKLAVYVRRKEIHKKLIEYIDGHARKPLVLSGPSGSGKSSIMSWLYQQYRGTNPIALVIPHFVGASPKSTNLRASLIRLCNIIQDTYGFEKQIPDETQELIRLFRSLLFLIPVNKQVVLIIDAINQLDKIDNPQEFKWVPEELPPNIKIVLSSIQGIEGQEEWGVDRINGMQLYEVAVDPLSDKEREKILKIVPSVSAKVLDDHQISLLTANPATRNPLFLLVALEELRGFGSFDDLNQRIKDLPNPRKTPGMKEQEIIPKIFFQVIERMEEEFNEELVRRVLSFIACSRQGLTEKELEQLVGNLSGKEDLFPVLRQLRQYLMKRNELVDCYHCALREAINSKYFGQKTLKRGIHIELADYFSKTKEEDRRVFELPWQLSLGGEWKKLFDLLSDILFLKRLWKKNEYEVRAYWARIEDKTELRITAAYRRVVNNPEKYIDAVYIIGTLLGYFGYLEEALILWKYMVEHCKKTGDKSNFAIACGNQAIILKNQGRLREAMKLNKESEAIEKELGDTINLRGTYVNQAVILQEVGRLEEAMNLLRKAEIICKEQRDKVGLSAIYGNQAIILYSWGRLEETMKLHRESEKICKELGDKENLSKVYCNQAIILNKQGRLEEAIKLHKKSEKILIELGNKAGLATSYANQANMLKEQGRLEEAMKLHKESEKICKELGDKKGLAFSCGSQANVLAAQRKPREAMKLHKEAEKICKELGNKAGLATSYENQADILNDRGRLKEAIELYKEAEKIYKELGNKKGLALSYGNQAVILQEMGRLEEAMDLQKNTEKICKELGDKTNLVRSYVNQAMILKARGRLKEALKLYKELEKICKELGYKKGLALSYSNQAVILQGWKRLEEAMKLHKEAEKICMELGDKADLSLSYGNQAAILLSWGRLEEAMFLIHDSYCLATETGSTDLVKHIRPLYKKIKRANRIYRKTAYIDLSKMSKWIRK